MVNADSGGDDVHDISNATKEIIIFPNQNLTRLKRFSFSPIYIQCFNSNCFIRLLNNNSTNNNKNEAKMVDNNII